MNRTADESKSLHAGTIAKQVLEGIFLDRDKPVPTTPLSNALADWWSLTNYIRYPERDAARDDVIRMAAVELRRMLVKEFAAGLAFRLRKQAPNPERGFDRLRYAIYPDVMTPDELIAEVRRVANEKVARG